MIIMISRKLRFTFTWTTKVAWKSRSSRDPVKTCRSLPITSSPNEGCDMGKSSTCRLRLTPTGPSTATACALLEPIAPRGRHSLKSKKGKGFRSGSRGLRLMSNWAYGLRLRPDGFWRRLIAVVLAHAVAVQALLFALGGFSLAASADQSKPAFELCSHDANGATQSPTSDSRPIRLHALHLLLCRSASCGDRHRAHGLPPRQCRDGGRAVAGRPVRLKAANPLHDRKSAGPPARRLTVCRPIACRIGR